MREKRVIVWFRNDLRIHDHKALSSALERSDEIIPVYCFDPRQFVDSELGIKRTASFRSKFLYESIMDLRQQIQSKGGNLYVTHGLPEVVIPEIVDTFNVSEVYFSEEITYEEKQVEYALEKNLWKVGVKTSSFWQSTLFHLEDLPFPVAHTPEVFTKFRKECEKFVEVRPIFPEPDTICVPSEIRNDFFQIPDWFSKEAIGDDRSVIDFRGGEVAGKKRLMDYIWERDCLKSYKETRNGLLGEDYSSKFSPWLALGCISPRYIYEEVKAYEQKRVKNQSTYWLIFELIWRDYFKFIAKKHGSKIFKLEGIKAKSDSWSQDEIVFQKWASGKTGIPFIDANMRELNATGFMSNRGRQLVASFLVNDLGIDWRWGALYFESLLIDYDVCSNWCNWLYVAGVGNDPRENRYFNIPSQAQRYDGDGAYVRHWIKELGNVQGFAAHHPFLLPTSEQKKLGIGVSYPYPIKDLSW
ncbi:DASH family cryptochrome [Belliella kenyensis]|uniref:Cryptochrome DASH n=1 Tax=Belliella kenyensis TaxID=1472724 RepID=A0ABV8EI27_9BACT|nr:DASH family cryptochrome [Belliella kenyensis]MCH7401420.1 DASH family cryptochrome [Belliella kenyensis]MDN3602863.1 DASH family cryptochrome [Belliella kenyensis]